MSQLGGQLGMALECFRNYWLEFHTPFVPTLPAIAVPDEGYGTSGVADPRQDRVAELWFDDYGAARGAIDSIE